MAYALRAVWEQTNSGGVLDRLEIYEDGFSGSTLQLKGGRKGFTFSHDELTSEGEGFLSIYQNRLQRGKLDFSLLIDGDATRQLVQDISTTTDRRDFQIVWKKDGKAVWKGFPTPDRITYQEQIPSTTNVLFSDIDILKEIEYTLSDNRQRLIETIANMVAPYTRR